MDAYLSSRYIECIDLGVFRLNHPARCDIQDFKPSKENMEELFAPRKEIILSNRYLSSTKMIETRLMRFGRKRRTSFQFASIIQVDEWIKNKPGLAADDAIRLAQRIGNPNTLTFKVVNHAKAQRCILLWRATHWHLLVATKFSRIFTTRECTADVKFGQQDQH